MEKITEEVRVEFLSTPDDEESLDFLLDTLDLPWIKIGSGEITNLPFLKKIAGKQKPIILSTGMSTFGEVERSARIIQSYNRKQLALFHYTTNYPCPPEEVNLRAMLILKQAFCLDAGYSDHTLGSEISISAVALGATIIEKHLTLSHNFPDPDHATSLEPQQFADMVKQIRSTEVALSNGIKWPNHNEEAIKLSVRRRIVAARNLPIGHQLSIDNLCFKHSDNGIFVENLNQILGMTLTYELIIR